MSRSAEHQFIQGFCKWCGAMVPGTNSTCLEREVPQSTLRPEPARRQFASEDFDTIGARVAELAQQRQDVLNAPEELPLVVDSDPPTLYGV